MSAITQQEYIHMQRIAMDIYYYSILPKWKKMWLLYCDYEDTIDDVIQSCAMV